MGVVTVLSARLRPHGVDDFFDFDGGESSPKGLKSSDLWHIQLFPRGFVCLIGDETSSWMHKW